MKGTDLLIENNEQPILVFQKKLERKANVESSSANLLLLRTTAMQVSGGFLFILVRMNSFIRSLIFCMIY